MDSMDIDEEQENSGCLSWAVMTCLFCMLMTGFVLGFLVLINKL